MDNTGLQQGETDILQYAQENAEFYGVEFEATFTLASMLGGDIMLTVFGDRIEGELDTAGDLPRMPPQRIGSRIEFTQGALTSYLSVIDADDQDKPGVNEEETEGYTRWDAGVSYRLEMNADQQAVGFIRLKNISNEEIRNSSSFLREIAPEAGRSIEAGVRYNF